MEEFLTELYSGSTFPLVSALVLGLMTAISPCPLATNITAIGFISRDVEKKRRVFYSGLIYTAGRAISYTLLSFIIILGADTFRLSSWFQMHGEKILGPLLLLMGLFMLGIFNFSAGGGTGKITEFFQKRQQHIYLDALLLGILFALAFCPYSGVLFFGGLIPMTVSASDLYLPVVFAVGTAIPVIIFAWLLAFTVSGVGQFYNRIKKIEYWFRRIIAVLFLGMGIYYIIEVYF